MNIDFALKLQLQNSNEACRERQMEITAEQSAFLIAFRLAFVPSEIVLLDRHGNLVLCLFCHYGNVSGLIDGSVTFLPITPQGSEVKIRSNLL